MSEEEFWANLAKKERMIAQEYNRTFEKYSSKHKGDGLFYPTSGVDKFFTERCERI